MYINLVSPGAACVRAAVQLALGFLHMLPATIALLPLAMTLPARPTLRSLPLPVKLAGGLFLFGTSVPSDKKQLSNELKAVAVTALRADPRVTMELGMGIEAGGIFTSASTVDSLVINFQITGGNVWAESTAFGVVRDGKLELQDLTIANMDASMSGTESLQVAIPGQRMEGVPQKSRMAEAMAAARAKELGAQVDEASATDSTEEAAVETATIAEVIEMQGGSDSSQS